VFSYLQVEVAKHPRHSFHPLHFLFVNVPSISRFQWHPFSLASGPKDSARSFVFHIKPQNLPKPEWTCKTSAKVAHVAPESDGKNASQCPMVKLFKTDGFYGSESDSFKRWAPFNQVLRGSTHAFLV
jgi:ferric-chelate reductase